MSERERLVHLATSRDESIAAAAGWALAEIKRLEAENKALRKKGDDE